MIQLRFGMKMGMDLQHCSTHRVIAKETYMRPGTTSTHLRHTRLNYREYLRSPTAFQVISTDYRISEAANFVRLLKVIKLGRKGGGIKKKYNLG